MAELEKRANRQKERTLLEGFLDFASTEGSAELMTLLDSGEDFCPTYRLVDESDLISRFLGIDGKKLEEERREILERHGACQEQPC